MFFLTGASGFLGGRLAEMLCDSGAEVTVLARAGSDLRHLSGRKITIVRADLSDATVLAEAVKPASYIVHCAACSTDWAARATYESANVTGTANLLEAARHAPGLKRFLHISTTDVYGYPLAPTDEDAPIVDAGLPYNQTKGRGEQLVWQAYREGGLPVTILRPATIFGPRGKDFTQEIATLLRQRTMATVDRGRARGGFTYVDNVAEAIIAAATSDNTVGRPYNIADATNATWADYLAHFARELHLPMPWIDLSFAAAMRVATLFELPHRALGLGGRPLLTRHAVYLLGRDQEFPVDRAIRDFGFRPQVGLEEGIERSVRWLVGNRKR